MLEAQNKKVYSTKIFKLSQALMFQFIQWSINEGLDLISPVFQSITHTHPHNRHCSISASY